MKSLNSAHGWSGGVDKGYDPSDLRIFNVFAGPDSWLTLLVIPTEKPSNKDIEVSGDGGGKAINRGEHRIAR